MARPLVSIRLGTEGKAQVTRDFVEIGNAGDAQSRRISAAFERDAANAERAIDKLNKTAQRLASAAPPSMQQLADRFAGVGQGSATANGATFSALSKQMDEAEREAKQLLAAIDPLFAAQQRYNQQTRRGVELLKLGAIDKQHYNQLIIAEKALLDQSTAAGVRNTQMRGNMRIGMQQLSFQAGDVATQMAMGTNASIIFAQQSGQVIQAMQLMGGEGNKFLKFLGGPWGIALATAAVVLTPFIGKLFEAEDGTEKLTDKLQKQAREAALTEEAQRAFGNTLEGVTEALRKNREALQGLSDTGKTAAERALDLARAELARLNGLRATTDETIRAARAQIELNKARANVAALDPRVAAPLLADNEATDARLVALQSTVAGIAAQIEEAERQITEAASHVAVERGSEDAVERIKRRYDELVESTRVRLVAEKATTAEIERQTKALRDKERAEVEAEQKRNRSSSNSSLPKVTGDEVARILGTTINPGGGRRTEAQNRRVGGAANSYHLSGQAIDIPLTVNGKPLTKEGIRSELEAAGVIIKELLGPGDKDHDDHFHIAFSTRRAGADQIAAARDRASRRQQREMLAGLRGDNRFGDMSDSLDTQLLEAKSALYASAQQELELALRRIDAANDNVQRDIEMAAAKGEITRIEAIELTLKNEALSEQEKANAAARAAIRQIEEQAEVDQRIWQLKIDDLEFQDEMARSTAEHRRIQLQIIEALYAQRRSELEAAKAAAEKAGNLKRAAEIQAEINNLPTERARDEERARRGTMSPMEEYLDSLPKSIEDLNERLQEIEVSGLKELNDQLRDAVMNADSLGDFFGSLDDIFHSVAERILEDLIDLAIQMYIMRPLAEALFGAGAGQSGSGGGGGLGAIIGAIGSALGAVFGGGGGAAAAGGGGSGGVPTGHAPFAVGTEYFSGGTAWVGEHGPELVRLPRGSKISTAAESRRMAAANDVGPRISVTNINDFRGADSAAIGAIESRLNQMEADLPARVIQSYQDAKQRFVIR